MATTNLTPHSIGGTQMQTGNGTPNHTGPIGAIYIDLDTGISYYTLNGTIWATWATGASPFAVSKVFADSPYLTSDREVVEFDATGGNSIITLPPAAVNNGAKISFCKIDATTNTVTLDGNAAETIIGATTLVLTARWEAVTLFCNGTSWIILG
jgi:hypothetical protein